MTIEELSKLSDEELRVMCAELCGYTKDPSYPSGVWNKAGTTKRFRFFFPEVFCEPTLPNYPADLNAMHEAEKTLNGDEQSAYMEAIGCNLSDAGWTCYWDEICATARQRCIAFIATKQSGREEGGE